MFFGSAGLSGNPSEVAAAGQAERWRQDELAGAERARVGLAQWQCGEDRGLARAIDRASGLEPPGPAWAVGAPAIQSLPLFGAYGGQQAAGERFRPLSEVVRLGAPALAEPVAARPSGGRAASRGRPCAVRSSRSVEMSASGGRFLAAWARYWPRQLGARRVAAEVVDQEGPASSPGSAAQRDACHQVGGRLCGLTGGPYRWACRGSDDLQGRQLGRVDGDGRRLGRRP